MTVLDTRARPLRDLRISVTDRCNFRCVYCMPKEVFGRDYEFLARDELLSFEEIERLARAAVALGVTKLRITGGEPLVRRDVERLIAMLAPLGGRADADDERRAARGEGAGAGGRGSAAHHRQPRLARRRDLPRDERRRRRGSAVLAGIDAARDAGLPVKVNCVVKRGVNDGEIVQLARHFRGTGDMLRFIEYMDVGETNGWRMDDVVPAAEIVAALDREFGLEPVDPRIAARSHAATATSTAPARSA